MWAATRRPARVLTVSEASKRDILRYFRVPGVEDRRHLQRDRRALREPPAAEDDRRGSRALSAQRSVRPLRRQHQAAQEPRAADRGVPPAAPAHGFDDVKLLIIGDEISKYADAAPRVHRLQAAQARALPRLRAGRDAGGALPAGGGVRVPVALRRLRPAAARGDGQRHAGHHVERLVAARGRRRRGAADRSVPSRTRSPTRCAGCSTDDRPAAAPAGARPGAGARVLVGAIGRARPGDLRRGAGRGEPRRPPHRRARRRAASRSSTTG